MKTDPEILVRIKEIDDANTDMFGWTTSELFASLTWEGAQKSGMLRPDTDRESWGEERATDEAVIRNAIDYLPHAIQKIVGHRGLSAARSFAHYQAWMWLIDKYDEIIWDDYKQYGAPVLKQICEKLGDEAESIWGALGGPRLLLMAEGFPCHEGCEDGCEL